MKQTVIVAVLLLLAGSLAWAQPGTGVIEGTVVDGRGQPVAGAMVTARHVATDTPYKMRTNGQGQYRFTTVAPGTYEVTTESTGAPGTAIHVVKVAAAASVTANFDPSTPLATKKELGAGKPVKPIRFEVGGRVGWTLSDGVSLGQVEAGDGNIYERVDPLDSLSWGFTAGFFLTSRLEIEFLFARQSTTLQASGVKTVDIGDLSISNYDGLVSYHFGSVSAPVRPYAIAGFGSTAYGTLTFTTPDGQNREIGCRNRWASSFGGGVKIYRKQVGARVEARYTPTYIKSQATGWWCDDYWGCYVTEKSQYANQFELSGGVSVRF